MTTVEGNKFAKRQMKFADTQTHKLNQLHTCKEKDENSEKQGQEVRILPVYTTQHSHLNLSKVVFDYLSEDYCENRSNRIPKPFVHPLRTGSLFSSASSKFTRQRRSIQTSFLQRKRFIEGFCLLNPDSFTRIFQKFFKLIDSEFVNMPVLF